MSIAAAIAGSIAVGDVPEARGEDCVAVHMRWDPPRGDVGPLRGELVGGECETLRGEGMTSTLTSGRVKEEEEEDALGSTVGLAMCVGTS